METLQVNRKQIEKLSTVLNNSRIKIFEYLNPRKGKADL